MAPDLSGSLRTPRAWEGRFAAQPTFTIAGRPIEVADWQFNDTEGGYDQCSGTLEDWSGPSPGPRTTARVSRG